MASKGNDKVNMALLMQKVFGDRLNGLSEAEIAFVKDSMIASLDKVKGEAKARAAWADVTADIVAVLVKHNKLDVVTNKGLRMMFDDRGEVAGFAIYKPRTGGGTNPGGKVKQYQEKNGNWQTVSSWASACDGLGLPLNGNSGKRVLETAGYETRISDKPA